MPIITLPQIGEETGGVFVKVQKSLAFDIKYPGPPLDQSVPRSEALEQIPQSLECAGTSMFHRMLS
jgi:hypothetical protein